ncbi:MAG TPA: hypothetical protein VKQ27_08810 [Acetobacteraceae bacterium]|nr:hypothetical protein [Acetobacteraceae bacterium]
MVRALLAGRKTQTRRLLSRARVFATPERPAFTLAAEHMARALQGASGFRHLDGTGWFWEADAFEWQAPAERTGWMANIGYAAGDRLYVRESYYQQGHWEQAAGVVTKGGRPKWKFVPDDDAIRFDPPIAFRKARHSADPGTTAWHRRLARFMPRSASRLTLIVEDVRVEQLQLISEADAQAEGVDRLVWDGDGGWYASDAGTHYCGFAGIWQHLHGAESWDANPFVVPVTFRVERGNIDQIGRTA